MENHPLPAETGVLDMLAQPVLYVSDEQIVFRNHAADRLLRPEQRRIGELLSESDLADYRAYRGVTALTLTLRLGGQPYRATVQREAGRDIFVAQADPVLPSLRPDALTVIARTLRRQLTDLFDAASALFSQLEEREDPALQQQTARINQNLYSLLRLSANLLDAGRLMVGEARLFPERTDLASFLARLCDKAAPLCAAEGVELRFQKPAKPVWISADRQRLERAVLNLLSNALRFTPRGGHITVAVDATPAQAYLRVRDDGEGIPQDVMAELFTRYERQEPLPGDSRQKVGLGLTLAYLIAQQHGGTVAVNSAPGGGTTVTMSLSRGLKPAPAEELHSPVRNFDYAGSFDHAVLELVDALPPELFDTRDV